MPVWAVLHGLRLHRWNIVTGREDYTEADELARPEPLVFIVETRLQVDGPGCLVDRVVDERQLALGQLLLAIAAIGVHHQRRIVLAFAEVVEIVLRERKADKD